MTRAAMSDGEQERRRAMRRRDSWNMLGVCVAVTMIIIAVLYFTGGFERIAA